MKSGALTWGIAYTYHNGNYALRPAMCINLDCEHSNTSVVVKAPTCTKNGITYTVCNDCNSIVEVGASTEKLGHTPVTDSAINPTCSETGLTEGSHCSVCNEVLTAQNEVAKIDHNDSDNDGYCDMCKNMMTGCDHCVHCGKIHSGFFGFFIKFFHKVAHLFSR